MYRKVKVIVAENTLDFNLHISRYLRNKNCDTYSLKKCYEMKSLCSKINEISPDVVIFNAGMFKGDIIRFIELLRSTYQKIFFIVLIPYQNNKFYDKINKIGATGITLPCEMHKIYEEIMIKNIFDDDLTQAEKIQYFLKNIGVSQKLKGFEYICTAVYITLFENENFKSITKEIYPEIALRYNTNYSNVERCIRNCITVFMKDNRNKNYFYNFISNCNDIFKNKDIKTFKMTNSKFIKIIAREFKIYHIDNNKKDGI